jgi:hypothetical protein
VAEHYETGSQFPMSRESLANADRDTQFEVMKDWFYEHFEDPAERTPYESAEGGYIWIWGGPYDAREQLEVEFGGVVPDDVIDDLVGELESECTQWAPTPSPDDYDNALIEDLARITEFYQNFSGAILDIERLLKTKVEDSVSPTFHRLLFVNVITAMETYLSDAFINTVVNSPHLMRRFIETTPEFQAEKIPLADVYKAMEQVEQRAKSYLADVVWHHLHRVKPMYRDTLDIEFPSEMGPLFRAVLLRHDIVHRNGKTKDGKEIIVTSAEVSDLIRQVEAFIQELDKQIASAKERLSEDESKKTQDES